MATDYTTARTWPEPQGRPGVAGLASTGRQGSPAAVGPILHFVKRQDVAAQDLEALDG
jgi:hypothetical protein